MSARVDHGGLGFRDLACEGPVVGEQTRMCCTVMRSAESGVRCGRGHHLFGWFLLTVLLNILRDRMGNVPPLVCVLNDHVAHSTLQRLD